MTATPASTPARPAATPRGHLAALLILAGVLAAMALLRSPFYDTPMFDDWTYVLPTVRLAQTGYLRYVAWNDACVVAQVLYGAAWLRLVGPSAANLRVLTLLVSLGAAFASFGILAELGLRWTHSLAGALVLLVSPHYIFCSYSWMTDVHALAFTQFALWAYLAGLRRGSGPLMWAGAGLAFIGILIRQTAAVVPFAALLYLLWRRRSYRGATRWLATAAPIVLGLAGVKLAERIPDYHAARMPALSLLKQYAAAPNTLALGLAYLGFALLPLGAAGAGAARRALRREPPRWRTACAGARMAGFALSTPAPGGGLAALARNQDQLVLMPLTFIERGITSGFLIGFGERLVPLWACHAVTALSLAWLAILLAVGWDWLAGRSVLGSMRLEERGARFGGLAAIVVAAGLVVLLAGLPLWRLLGETAVRAAHERGMGHGRGLDHWLGVSQVLVRQAVGVAALVLMMALAELGWQSVARRRQGAWRGALGQCFVLSGFAEFLILALAVGAVGAGLMVVALKLLWRVRMAEAPVREAAAPAADDRAAVVFLSGGGLAVFLVLVASRWEVYPRHYLHLLFPATLLVLMVARARRLWLIPFALVALVRLAYGLVMTDVYVSQMVATAETRRELVASGVPPKEIRAGLELDGLHWRWYSLDHPQEGADRRGEPWPVSLVPVLRDTYIVAGGLASWQMDLSGYEVVHQKAFQPRLWPRERPIYVLRRKGTAARHPPTHEPGSLDARP